MTKHYFICLFALLLAYSDIHAQTTEKEVIQTIFTKDSLFWAGYNDCNIAQCRPLIADNVEFYHDKGGILNGVEALCEALQKNLCNNPVYHLRREAIDSTVKVFPLSSANVFYGAIISGEHLFYVTDKGQKEYLDGHANFMQLWILKDGVWKMTRILSYNHHPATKK